MIPFSIRRLDRSDAALYRELRLEGLHCHPEAFGSSWEEEVSRPPTWFAERLERNAVFGAQSSSRSGLAGVVGLMVPEAVKVKHKGVLWGMFVRSEAQHAGLGSALVARVIEHAAQVVEDLQLTVVSSNTAAVRLYERAGFTQYGMDERALKVGGRYYDERMMTLLLNRPD